MQSDSLERLDLADTQPGHRYRRARRIARGLTLAGTLGIFACAAVAAQWWVDATRAGETDSGNPLLPETGGFSPPRVELPLLLPTPEPTIDPQATIAPDPEDFPRVRVITKANVRTCAGHDCPIEMVLDEGTIVRLLGRAEEDPDWAMVASDKWEGVRYMHQNVLSAGEPLP